MFFNFNNYYSHYQISLKRKITRYYTSPDQNKLSNEQISAMNKVRKSAIKVEEMDRKDEIKLGLSILVERKDRNVERKNQESKHTKSGSAGV